jgi:hypothetical protein
MIHRRRALGDTPVASDVAPPGACALVIALDLQ